MKREIKKCEICSEPFWIKSLGDNVCPDCIKTADNKEFNEANKPHSFGNNTPPTVGRGDCKTINIQ